jgi:hypothetical protein
VALIGGGRGSLSDSGEHGIARAGYGHDHRDDCAFRITRDLFDTPERELDTTCLASVPPIDFVTGVLLRGERTHEAAPDGLGWSALVGIGYVLVLWRTTRSCETRVRPRGVGAPGG